MRIDATNRIYDAYNVQGSLYSKKANQIQSKDEVKFSTQAKDFATCTKLLSQVPDVRSDLVEKLKDKISSGNYNIQAEEIAEKIVSQFSVRG